MQNSNFKGKVAKFGINLAIYFTKVHVKRNPLMAKSKPSNQTSKPHQPIVDVSQKKQEITPFFEKLSDPKALFMLWACVLLICLAIFKDYIFHKKYYLFLDLGADSINIIYTNLMYYAEYFRTEGFPAWSFKAGLGQNINPFWLDPIASILLLFGKENIAGGLVFVVITEIFLAATFFFLFLRTLLVNRFSAIVGAISYSFCGYLVVCSTWDLNKYPTEVYQAAFLLFALEYFLSKGRWYYLPLAIALVSIHQPFYLYLYGVLILVYTLVRSLEKSSEVLPMVLQLGKIAILGVIGVGLASFILPINILQIIESPRVAGGVSYFDTLSSVSAFDMSDGIQMGSACLRFFSNDLLGTGSDYRGWQNYVEAPLFYCGLLTLVAVPQAFALASRRQVMLYGVLAFLCFLIVVFPYFRYAFWLFSGDYYRTAGFFVTILLLFLGYRAVSIITQESRINLVVLGATLVVLLFLLFGPYDIPKENINVRLRTAIAFFVILQSLVLWALSRVSIKNIAQVGAVILIVIEVIFLEGTAVNKRNAASVSEYAEKSSLFEDNTNIAVAKLQEQDKSFYRIDKDYASSPAIFAGLNDGKLQDYYGTTCYSSFNQVNYVRFLLGMGLIKKGDEFATRWVNGLGGNTLLESICGVKYVLVKNTLDLRPQGFTAVDTVGDIKIFSNNNVLPLGFTYNQYIDEKEFTSLPLFPRQKALLHACVLSAERGKKLGLKPYSQIDTTGILNGEEYNTSIAARKADAFQITSFKQNDIQGEITAKQSQLLYFSIPFDQGWQATVDNKIVDLEKVSFGFMGLSLPQGRHKVVLHYTVPYLKIGIIVSLSTLLVYLVLLGLFRKKSF